MTGADTGYYVMSSRNSERAPVEAGRRRSAAAAPDRSGMKSGYSWHRTLLILTVTVLMILPQVLSIQWLALSYGKQMFWNNTRHCSRRRSPGLLKPQVQICKRNLELMPVVAHASKDVIDVCEELFTDSRWNCSSIRLAPDFLADLTGGSREQAFVYALASAAITQSVSKACSVGVTAKCGCGRLPNEPPPGEFKWGGCGDDVRFGAIFGETFTDAPTSSRKRRGSRRQLMNGHNNAVGRKIVQDSLTTACKCHGVSGSCSIKTCWMALPDLRSIGVSLQKRYAVAVEVRKRKPKRGKRRKSPGAPTDASGLVAVSPGRRRFAESDLVYYTKSPDYCYPDPALGSLGTHGRECKKDQQGSGGCKSMCCGRGYTSEIVRVRHRCDCKYYWCCYVKCKTCTKEVEINRCK